jgi:hypothetical protein
VRYVEDATINVDMLFCKPHKEEQHKQLFKIVDDLVREKSIKWSHCVGIWTHAACVMAGYEGLQALIKGPAPEAMWTHCMTS